ncbi:MAG: penicillin-binding protein 2 [Kiritimatiellae bacterium]|nr:penicillin-binding protein 2 [Kiritimatiellia bacterium]
MTSVRRLAARLAATMDSRMAVVAFFLACMFVYVGRKLVLVQLWPDASVVAPVEYTQVVKAYRGGIYDRRGKEHPLAQTMPAFKVFVDPQAVRKAGAEVEVYSALARHGAFAREKIYAALSAENSRYRPLGETVDSALVADISTNRVFRHRVGLEKISRRSYPLGRGLCHVIGTVNSAEEPLYGLEKTLDAFLRGTDGRITGDADRNRREIRSRRKETVAPVDGCDVILAIDERMQFAVDTALDRAMEKWHPRAAWAIVQDCNTGEILAMASRPDFDPLRFGSTTPDEQSNRAISTLYEPGSVMKTFAAAAAMDEGLVGTNTLLDVSPGLYCGKPLSDHTHGKSQLTVSEMLAWSSNRGASRLGMMLGKARQQAHLKAFGFGRTTGLALRGEGVGTTIGDGSELNNIRISMGQGMTCTAIQLCGAYSAIANGGRLLKPILVKEIRRPDGSTAKTFAPEVVSRPVSERTAAQLRDVLKGVTRPGGTARRAAVSGYSTAGKTGTAQMVVNGRYSKTLHRGSFVGFIPAEAPQYTILVTLEAVPPAPDQPKAYHGGVSAAPVFAEIAEAAARIFAVEPDDPG